MAGDARRSASDMIIVFISILGIAVAFFNIYHFAQERQPGNAVWGGIALFAFSQLLATRLAMMRLAATPVKPAKSTK